MATDVYHVLVEWDLWMKPEHREKPYHQLVHPIPAVFRTAAGAVQDGLLQLSTSDAQLENNLQARWPAQLPAVVLLFDSFDRSFRNLEQRSSDWGFTNGANTHGAMWSAAPGKRFRYDAVSLNHAADGMTLAFLGTERPHRDAFEIVRLGKDEEWTTLIYNERTLHGQTYYSHTQLAIRHLGAATDIEFVSPMSLPQVHYSPGRTIDLCKDLY